MEAFVARESGLGPHMGSTAIRHWCTVEGPTGLQKDGDFQSLHLCLFMVGMPQRLVYILKPLLADWHA